MCTKIEQCNESISLHDLKHPPRAGPAWVNLDIPEKTTSNKSGVYPPITFRCVSSGIMFLLPHVGSVGGTSAK